jgi:glutamate formiminotransferase / 5-formyltetrahydrofolate cyclo-ligase
VPIECVVNVSEGRNETLLAELALTVAPVLLDRHTDADHHRSVFTLAGTPDDVRQALTELATACVGRLDLGPHQGAHPRLGVVDVVPFIPLHPGQLPAADLSAVVPLRDEFAQWLSGTFDLPSFLYGPLPGGQSRTLPQVRRTAFIDLAPDFGPVHPHRTAGATAVGARPILVAYNIWVSTPGVARQVAPLVRSSTVRALGLAVGDRAQVSCNLVDPAHFGPAQLYDQVNALITEAGGAVTGAELVGLLPQTILAEIPKSRWAELGLSANSTIESRLLD